MRNVRKVQSGFTPHRHERHSQRPRDERRWTVKPCTRCGEVKPLDEFNRNKRKKDGRDPNCKACAKAYYRANRERILANKVEYHEANKDRINPRQREYHRSYYEANKERVLAKHAEWRAENKERISEYHAERRVALPHIYWESSYITRVRKYGFEPVVESFTRDELVTRWGSVCVYCGGPFEQLDHAIIPVRDGGAHSLDNCRPSCASCNASRNQNHSANGSVMARE